tara:strand:- start:626 stop:1027 length:402 start_codon:yes stop_codon:yes gene_type:complete
VFKISIETKSKILDFVVNHWREIALVILALTIFAKMRYDYRQLEMAYEASERSLQEQIEGLQEIHKNEIDQREKALKDYRKMMEELELKLLERQREIEEGREEARERHIYEFTHDKESLAKFLEEEFGIVYVP